MAYTRITEIVAPSSAVAGETVDVTIKIQNTWTGTVHVSAIGVLDSANRFIDWLDYWIPAGATHSFSGHFTMPDENVTINAYSYYEDVEGYWRLDASKSQSVSLEAKPVGWLYLTTRHISVEKVEAIIGWLYLTTRQIAIKIAEPIIGWLYLTTKHISIKKKEPVIPPLEWLYLTTRHIQVERKGVIPPEEEVKFPWGAVALVGGGAVALAAVAKAKKKKS